MKQAVKPNSDIVNYNDLKEHPDDYLIFLKADNKIIGFVFMSVKDNYFSVQLTSEFNDFDEYESIEEIVDDFSKILNKEITVWYEKVN